ncbi:unnamed protein product [Ranitomeya imitator]|uniref:OCIA domain-containing protein 1 n=1 Tax=Ranitomeya imitator TaxID=111125 RepID=A0ABN9ME07_9NEOB|nr:unnamed protein product [Ranitomeya imitator]
MGRRDERGVEKEVLGGSEVACSCRKRAEKKAEMADRQCGILMHCPITSHGHREEFGKIIKECKEESFWYRALPLSLTSMLATQVLIHQGYLSTNKRFGSLPKLALAGFLGFTIGKISYFGTCQKKFEKLGVQNPFEAGFTPGIAGPFGPGFFNRNSDQRWHNEIQIAAACQTQRDRHPGRCNVTDRCRSRCKVAECEGYRHECKSSAWT